MMCLEFAPDIDNIRDRGALSWQNNLSLEH